jgi:uncharacterized protein YndB with AHSA1/START domain
MFRQMLTRLGVPAVVAAVFLMAVLLMAYEIRARWTENGRDITQAQKVAVAPGAHMTVEFSTREGNRVMTMKGDLAHRSPEIKWPAGFTPDDADLFSHNEIHINAPCEKVWKHLVEAPKWPTWYPNSKDVRIAGGGSVLTENSEFSWTTFDLPFECKITEFVPFTRIGWYGHSPGKPPSNYHPWYLIPEGDGCRVVTDEVGKGANMLHLRKTDESRMHRGHDLWLATLKWVAESP